MSTPKERKQIAAAAKAAGFMPNWIDRNMTVWRRNHQMAIGGPLGPSGLQIVVYYGDHQQWGDPASDGWVSELWDVGGYNQLGGCSGMTLADALQAYPDNVEFK